MSDDKTDEINRRHFLRLSSLAVGAAGALGSVAASEFAEGAALRHEQRELLTVDDIIAAMKRGNERFRRGERVARNYLAEQRGSSEHGQHPAAVILSCIDSRAPAEVIMDFGIGDVFNARVAGNIADQDMLGSLEFACKITGAKVVLVMGHTACGAIKGAIDNAELGNLTQLLAQIRPAVEATPGPEPRTSMNPQFVDAVARKHVELTIERILRDSPVLRELDDEKKIDIVGAMYDIATAKVDFL